MDVLIVVGDQDTYHEDDHEIVSSPIWLADILSAEGIRGHFAVHARRAEILAEQGRTDVIAAMRRHEIGLHGRDIHPVIPEVVEGLDWADGVEALMAVEGAELATLGRVFDVTPACSSEHRGYTAPQLFGVARQLGLPYLFGPAAAPPYQSVSWFAGALNVPFDPPVPDFLGFFPAVFDDALNDDAAFNALMRRLREHIDRCLAARLPLLAVFTCHPERLCYAGPLERWQYGNGRNHGRAAVPPGVEVRRTRAEVERALTNFRTLVRYLRDAPGLEPATVADVVRRYGRQPETITGEELAATADEALRSRTIPLGPTHSAAELGVGFAEALAQRGRTGALPDHVRRRDALGPVAVPPLWPERPGLSSRQIDEVAAAVLAEFERTGHLPAAIDVDGRAVGLGSLFGAFADAYRRCRSGAASDDASIPLDVWPRYPASAHGLAERQRKCAEDPLVRPGLSLEAPARLYQLQSWTLKLAQRS